MNSKKVAIITPTFLPYRGGMCVVAEQDARQLAALGCEVDVLTPGYSFGAVGGYAIKPLRPWFKYGNAALVPGAFRACHGYDLVVLHYPFYGGAEAVALAKKLGCCNRLAIYYHMDTVGRGASATFFRGHNLFIQPKILRLADRILVSSFDYARSAALREFCLAQPSLFRELPPAVDIERFKPGEKPPELLTRYKLNAQRPIILFVGGLDRAHYFKGVQILIQALKNVDLQQAQVVIVGGGGLIEEYQTMARHLGIEKRVTFTGPVSDAELPLHYLLADVFAFPSLDRSEAFGIAALEAMASGIPVVASDLPGVRTIVRPGETGYLAAPKSVSALTARLLDVLSDSLKRKELSSAGRRMAIEEYSEKRRIDKWERIAKEFF
jgi:glycosyltransferase involved in cell wall biosynthesis